MIKGSTPTHKFNLPFTVDIIDKLQIKYAQNDENVITKEKADCVLDGKTICVTLKQEETLLFDCHKTTVQIQLKIKTLDGKVVISRLLTAPLEKCLFDEVL